MNNPKPRAKQHTHVIHVNPNERYAFIECTPEAWNDIQKFISIDGNNGGTRHAATVSSLYDFGEVIAYIENWQPADLSAFENVLPVDNAPPAC